MSLLIHLHQTCVLETATNPTFQKRKSMSNYPYLWHKREKKQREPVSHGTRSKSESLAIKLVFFSGSLH